MEHAASLPAEYPVIVVGDFNASAQQSRPYDAAIAAGFSDAWISAQERIGPSVTFSSFTAPSPEVDNRIDWILHRGPITVSQCETILYNENGRYPSDHLPVFARLHLEAGHAPAK
jgi:endonuclease/exonuclease/phosphatase family metal-dependent hydrolase